MIEKKWKPLHLFLYHKNDDVTRANYEQLALIEGDENVQPISDSQSYLPNTFRADLQKWPFPHWDSYWMCDGLIYKYLLYNKERVLSSSYVSIIEYDTWWQYSSKEWMQKAMKDHDIIGSNFLSFGKNQWEFFEKHKHLHFANQLRGLVPFSAICIKPETSIAIAERVQADPDFHSLYNNEMRIATAANIIKSKIGLLPLNISKNVQWHGCLFTDEKSIYHPVKTVIRKPTLFTKRKKSSISNKEFGIITCAFYDNEEYAKSSVERLKNSVNGFGYELIVATGKSCKSLQDIKVKKLRPTLEDMDQEWIMWVDATDTYCVKDPIESIDLVKKCGKEILISAERNCWPENNLAHNFSPSPYENDEFPYYRFLNSGVFVGLRKNVIKHLKILESMMEKDNSLEEPWMTDQALWTRMFIQQKELGASIKLDLECNLSISTIDVDEKLFTKYKNQEIDCVQISPTKGCPIILHFNGNDKHNTKKINYLIELAKNTTTKTYDHSAQVRQKIITKKSTANHGKVKDFAIKLSNKMHPTQRVTLNVEGSGKAHVSGHLDMTWRPVGKNRMSLFHTKNKSKIGEIIKNPSTGEYLVVLDVFGKTSSTAWIGKEI